MSILDPHHLLAHFGELGLFPVLAAETGLPRYAVAKASVLARSIPIVRTVMSPLAVPVLLDVRRGRLEAAR